MIEVYSSIRKKDFEFLRKWFESYYRENFYTIYGKPSEWLLKHGRCNEQGYVISYFIDEYGDMISYHEPIEVKKTKTFGQLVYRKGLFGGDVYYITETPCKKCEDICNPSEIKHFFFKEEFIEMEKKYFLCENLVISE